MLTRLGQTISHYTILSKLGEGGMGTVYLARDEQLDRTVAIKFLSAGVAGDAATLSRFRLEARSVARLKHLNIVTIYEFGEHEGTPYLVMEHVEGRTLTEMLEAGPLPMPTAADIAIQLCNGLASAHEAGITHRDIKPGNVVVDEEGRARILDFGLAKVEGTTAITTEETTVGTVMYMSPEQASGREVDGRSDLFSLGSVLFEMLTGRPPFAAEHAAAVAYRIVHDAHEALPAELDQFNSVIARALAKDPGSRFQSATEFGNAVRVIVGQSAEAAPVRHRMWKRVTWISVALAIVVAAALLISPLELRMGSPESGENKLAVMYFDNMVDPADPKRHGEMLAELLITGLSESQTLSVLSSQRLYDLLKQMGKEGQKRVDETTATDVATRANARWMMLGRILQTEPAFVVTCQIVDVATGVVTVSQRTDGETGESLFSLVDRITARTLDDLAVPEAAAGVRPVAEMSTASEEAYRYFLEGVDYDRRYFLQEASESYQKTLAIDSTFAMAAFRQARFARQGEAERLFRQFIRHADPLSPQEQLYVPVAEAMVAIGFDRSRVAAALEAVLEEFPDDKLACQMLIGVGTQEQRIKSIRRWLELDPTDPEAWNQLAYTYAAGGDYENAVSAVEKYGALLPDEPNPYDTAGDIYTMSGRLDEAIAAYEKAVAIKPDFANYQSAQKLGHRYADRGDYERAESQYRRVLESQDAWIRSWARNYLISLLIHRGRYVEALEANEAAEQADRFDELVRDPSTASPVQSRVRMRAHLLRELGDTVQASAATAEYLALLEQGRPYSVRQRIIVAGTLVVLGAVDEASRYLEPLRVARDSLGAFEQWFFDLNSARVEAARGNLDGAVTAYERLWGTNSRDPALFLGFELTYLRVYVAACIEAKRWTDAVCVGEKALTIYPMQRVRSPRFHYYLGVAYQELGRNEAAIQQLDKFLAIWEDADPRLPEWNDARERLDRLKRSG